MTLREVLAADVAAAVLRRQGESPARHRLRALLLVWLVPRHRAVVLYRVAQRLHRSPLKPLALVLSARVQRVSGAELHPAADLGPGLLLVHSTGVVVGERVVAGGGLRLHQGVTLGERVPGGPQPVLGQDVCVGAGAAVLGGVRLGDGATVGANSVVLDDVAAGGVVAGAPARPVAS